MNTQTSSHEGTQAKWTSSPRRHSLEIFVFIFSLLGLATSSLSAQEAAGLAAPTSISAPSESLELIQGKQIGAHLKFLSSDLLKGRDTASEGEQLAASYISSMLTQMGLDPAGDLQEDGTRSYLQKFPLYTVQADLKGSKLIFTHRTAERQKLVHLEAGEDFTFFPRALAPGQTEAEVVFGGFGIQYKKGNIDDLAGLNLKGKILLVLDGSPQGVDLPTGRRSPASWRNKRKAAKAAGAIGVLMVHQRGIKTSYRKRHAFAYRQFSRKSLTLDPSPKKSSIPMLYVENHARDFFIENCNWHEKSERGPIAGLKAQFTFAANVEEVTSANVAAMRVGEHPTLKKEILVYSAHYDHIGVDASGSIYNGADDNASGTSSLLSIAKAFAEGHAPKRSVLFLWVSGEEKGLLGSQYFTENPSMDSSYEMIADINFDMMGRHPLGEIGLTPSPKHKDYNSLSRDFVEIANQQQIKAKFNADSYYSRSDHYNFAKLGMPVIFFFSGMHGDYHKPTDTFEKINLEKCQEVARLGFRLGWHVTQSPKKPHLIAKDNQSE